LLGIASGEVKGPRILTVGDPFYPKGGTTVYIKSFLEAHQVPSCEVDSADQATARVRRQIQSGADGIKIFAASFAGGGKIVPMPLEIAKAIVTEAHRARSGNCGYGVRKSSLYDLARAGGISQGAGSEEHGVRRRRETSNARCPMRIA
jgi:hypothetical protein